VADVFSISTYFCSHTFPFCNSRISKSPAIQNFK
jgi:hypothetical protein